MTSFAWLLIAAAGTSTASPGVLLDFSASWCGPCRKMSPIVSRLARQGYPIRKVDIDKNPQLARQYGVREIPAFVLVVRGKEVARIVGMTTERRLKQLMSRIPKPRSRKNTLPHKRLPRERTRSQNPTAKDESAIRLAGDFSDGRKQFQMPITPANKRESPEREIDPPRSETRGTVVRAKLGPPKPVAGRLQNRDPMAASVRIRIKDGGGASYGSGTIIDSRPGRTVILTCAHIFRGMKSDAIIEVSVFEGRDRTARTFVGTVIRYDMKADVGLLSIPTAASVPAIRLGTESDRVRKGDHVFSIGCGGGSRPRKLQMRVTAVNRYLGPDNIECTVLPQQGRSGGGLFNAKGRIVGVCFAQDPRDRRGLYADLKPIYALLRKSGLSHLVRSPFGSVRSPLGGSITKTSAAPSSSRGTVRTTPHNSSPGDGDRSRSLVIDHSQLALMRATTGRIERSGSASAASGRPPFATDSTRLKTVAGMFKKFPEAEVICIIRPLNNSRAVSRVVIINRASSKFMEFLSSERRLQPRSTMKSMKPAVSAGYNLQAGRQSASRERFANSQPPHDEPGRYRRSRTSR